MAPNTNNDWQDILFFRQLISDALSRKLSELDWAVAHLNQLLEGAPETQASDNKKTRKSYSPKEAVARFPEYRDIIRTFIQYAEADREYVREFFVWRACLQFAVIKKEIAEPDCDLGEIQPYSKSTPLWKEVAGFLAESYWCDRTLTRTYLSDISERMSSLSVLNAVCDNPFLNRKYVQLGQAAEFIERALYYLGESDQKLFAREIVAYQVALNLDTINVLLNLRHYEWTAKDIAPASISPTDFAKFKEKVESLPFGKTAFATYPEGKEEYRKVLDRILATAVEQGHISQDERNAILGGIEPDMSSVTEPYDEPNDEDKLECFPGLKPALRDMAKIRRIAEITADFGCIEEKDIPLFIFRLSGNGRPNNLDPISWKPKYSDAPRHKASPVIRHPYELYYLLHYMYEGSSVMYADKVFSFFNFDAETQKKAESTLRQTKNGGIQQFVKMVKNDFQERLHNAVDASVFPLSK